MPGAEGRRAACGSSPRLRGTRDSPAVSGAGGRFIPAFAGNTAPRTSVVILTPVHPRVCGEHQHSYADADVIAGSSPRLRGTRTDPRRTGFPPRFIPAFAGNTIRAGSASRPPAVHPRVCGEHNVTHKKYAEKCGSSPRLRGTRRPATEHRLDQRFIPAFAGNTANRPGGSGPPPVHPRVCGEHGPCCSGNERPCGSSPRLRGTPATTATYSSRWRFIPAFAGNTPGCRAGWSTRTVHPRVCGEHVLNLSLSGSAFGSSPRLRGTLGEGGLHVSVRRFIPAFAGNTHGIAPLPCRLTVHPRVCGEHSIPAKGST